MSMGKVRLQKVAIAAAIIIISIVASALAFQAGVFQENLKFSESRLLFPSENVAIAFASIEASTEENWQEGTFNGTWTNGMR